MGNVVSSGHKKIGRNDLCPCGSGKKHKRCCLETPATSIISNTVCHIIDVAMEGINEIPIPDDRNEAFMHYEILSNIYDEYDEDVQDKYDSLEEVHKLVKKFPYIGDLWALLVIGYRVLGMSDRSIKILKKSSTRFPNNRTLLLLSYLNGLILAPPSLSFSPSTVTQMLIWSHIRICRSLVQDDLFLVKHYLTETLANAYREGQSSHWSIHETLFLLQEFVEDESHTS